MTAWKTSRLNELIIEDKFENDYPLPLFFEIDDFHPFDWEELEIDHSYLLRGIQGDGLCPSILLCDGEGYEVPMFNSLKYVLDQLVWEEKGRGIGWIVPCGTEYTPKGKKYNAFKYIFYRHEYGLRVISNIGLD